MKNIIMTALLALMALSSVQAKDANIEACKTYISEAKSFQASMDTKKVSKATFAFYKDKEVAHCGNIMSKMPFEKNYFANVLMKKDTTTVSNCKLSIKMAKAYNESGEKSAFIVSAHKVNIMDNCGALVAKKVPAFCLFDVVDNSKDDLKDKCLASIDKAHAAIGTKNIATLKKEVVANCSKLENSL